MKTKMIQEMTIEERKSLQNEMEAFAPKLKRLEQVSNAQSPMMAWTPACGNYLPEGLRILCQFKESKPYAEDALTNGKTADATKEFVVFWKMAIDQLNQILSEKECDEENHDTDAMQDLDVKPIYEQDGNESPQTETEQVSEQDENPVQGENNDIDTKTDGKQTRRGRK